VKAAVAIGSNLGDRLANLKHARDQVRVGDAVRPPVESSAIYETNPIGCEEGAPKFLNAVIVFDYAGEAATLLQMLSDIERRAGRPRDHAKNISRTLDLDLLFLGNAESDTDELQLPHPRIANRRFVLAPLADVCPDLVLPGQTATVTELLTQLPDDEAVVRFSAKW
jgi:2-amino-4-hydroxy-6-hydroxymethyldihydropteridine diphosphokinase